MPETAQTSAEIEARIRSTRERIDELSERERTVNQDIGRGIANGGEVGPLRDERRNVRDEIEDLTAALPHLERQVEAAQKAEAAAALTDLLSESERIRARVSESISEVYPALESAFAAVDAVLQAHFTEYVIAIGKAVRAAEQSGQRPPPEHFVLPNADPHAWQAFRDQLDKLLRAAPDVIRPGGGA